jgi:hypothetical protein
MHVRTVQSFRVNTLHAVVSFHSASKYLVPESPQPEREGSGRIYILATCPNRDRPRHLSRRTTPSPKPPGHHREYIASEGLTTFTCVRAPPALVNKKKISWQEEPLPPEGGSLDSKTYIFHQPATREGVGGGERSSAARRDN